MAPVFPLPNFSSPARALQTAAETLHPTRTLPHLLNQRQSQTNPDGGTITVVSNDSDDSSDPDSAKTLSGGAIAGIVIGSIAGFLLLAWIIRSCTNLGAPPGDEAVPGRPWYGGVRGRYAPRHPPDRSPGPGGGGAGGHAYGYEEGGYDYDYDRGRHSRSHSRHRHHRHHHHSHHHSGSRSRRASMVEGVPVQEIAPVAMRSGSRRRSRSRGYYE
ncbi:hypothetical protein VTG60DRAFT_6147 [Thermothelomyces hinnuleus]